MNDAAKEQDCAILHTRGDALLDRHMPLNMDIVHTQTAILRGPKQLAFPIDQQESARSPARQNLAHDPIPVSVCGLPAHVQDGSVVTPPLTSSPRAGRKRTLPESAVDGFDNDKYTADSSTVNTGNQTEPVFTAPVSHDNKNCSHKLFVSRGKSLRMRFRHLISHRPESLVWTPGDGFAESEAVPDFTFFTTGRHKRRYTKTAPEFGALQIEPSNDLENTRPRTPIRPKIQRLTQHQRELRRGPARDFWPTQQDFTDDTFVFRDRAKLVRTIEGATADDSLQGFTPEAERPGIDATFRPNFTYIIPSTKHGAVDFENFRRLRKGEVDTRSDLSNAFDKIKVWRSFSETDSDEEEGVAEEAEYLSFSSSGSDRATDEDCAATLRREEGNMSDFDDEYSIGSISTSHSKLSSDTADGSEASELGTTTGLLKNGGGWAQFSTSQSDATLSGQSYFKMMRARRAASRGWGTGQQLRRQQSDVQCGDRDTGASIIIPRTPLLSRQLTT